MPRLGVLRCWDSQIFCISSFPALKVKVSRPQLRPRRCLPAWKSLRWQNCPPRVQGCVLAEPALRHLGSVWPESGPLPLGQWGAQHCLRAWSFVLGVCLEIGLDQGLDHLSRGWSRLRPHRFEELMHRFKGWTAGGVPGGTEGPCQSDLTLFVIFIHLDFASLSPGLYLKIF